MKEWLWCIKMWTDILPPISSPLVYYMKEWMSIWDYTNYTGGGNPDRLLINSFDIVFTNTNLFSENEIVMVNVIVWDDSTWITKFKVWNGNISKTQPTIVRLQEIEFTLPEYIYFIGDVNSYRELRSRTLKISKKLKHNYKTMNFWI